MFAKNLVGEALGTSDNCSIILQKEQARAQSSFAALMMPHETAYVLMKSVKKEYLFTDHGLIISAGEAAVGTKRLARRYNWFESIIRNVMFETAGVGLTDLDCEVKFTIGNESISIDCKKQDDPNARILVSLLSDLARTQARNAQCLKLAEATLTRSIFNGTRLNGDADERANIVALVNQFDPESYAPVFQRHLSNR